MPCFNDKQWILITTNLESGRFFDIMNPDGSGHDRFTTIISIVCYNFKSLFALTYPNCSAFNIKDFDYRFIAVPRTHFRLSSLNSYVTNSFCSNSSKSRPNNFLSYGFFVFLTRFDSNILANRISSLQVRQGGFLLQILKTYHGMGVLGFSTIRVSYFLNNIY